VCYAHSDSAIVYDDLAWLRDRGVNLWYDEGITAGAEWREELGHAIEGCDSFVVFLSRASLASPHCLKELNFALELDRPLLVVWLEEVELTPGLKLSLNDRQALLRHVDAADSFRNKLLEGLRSTPPATIGAGRRRKPVRWWTAGVAAVLVLAIGAVLLYATRTDRAPVADNSIAVLPLTEVGAGARAYLGRGIAEELMIALHRMGDLRVASRTDSFQVAGSGDSVASMAVDLGVRMVLQGTVRQTQGAIRVNVELFDAVEGYTIWSESYDRELADLLSVQADISRDLAIALGREQAAEARNQVISIGTANREAYRLGIRGSQLRRNVGQPELLAEGIASLQRAIELDPYYFELYQPLAVALFTLYLHTQDDGLPAQALQLLKTAENLEAPPSVLVPLKQFEALWNHDLFQYVRLQHQRISVDLAAEWDPVQEFLDSPRVGLAIMLSLAGFFDDAQAYHQSVRHLASSGRNRDGFARFDLELTAARGEYREFIDQLENCQNQLATLLSPLGCRIRLFRAYQAIGDEQGSDAQLDQMRDSPVHGYLTAVANDDQVLLDQAADGSNPSDWMVHYRVLLDAGRHDDAFAFWRKRFPHAAAYFLWDTLMLRTRESPEIENMPGYQSLLAFYGITPAWRQQLCNGLYELEAKTGIEPVCGASL